MIYDDMDPDKAEDKVRRLFSHHGPDTIACPECDQKGCNLCEGTGGLDGYQYLDYLKDHIKQHVKAGAKLLRRVYETHGAQYITPLRKALKGQSASTTLLGQLEDFHLLHQTLNGEREHLPLGSPFTPDSTPYDGLKVSSGQEHEKGPEDFPMRWDEHGPEHIDEIVHHMEAEHGIKYDEGFWDSPEFEELRVHHNEEHGGNFSPEEFKAAMIRGLQEAHDSEHQQHFFMDKPQTEQELMDYSGMKIIPHIFRGSRLKHLVDNFHDWRGRREQAERFDKGIFSKKKVNEETGLEEDELPESRSLTDLWGGGGGFGTSNDKTGN